MDLVFLKWALALSIPKRPPQQLYKAQKAFPQQPYHHLSWMRLTVKKSWANSVSLALAAWL